MKNLIALAVGLACLVCLAQAVSFRELSTRDIDEDAHVCIQQSFGRFTRSPCESGTLIGTSCYGDCPAGYFSADSDGFRSSDDADTFGHGPQVYCWSSCPSDYSDQYDSCVQPTAFGQQATLPDYAFDGPRYAQSQSECEAEGSQSCEQCDDGWVPTSDCGPCAQYCPVICPAGYEQIDNYTCSKPRMGRPVVSATATCPAGYAQDPSSDVAVNCYSSDCDPCYYNAPSDYSCDGIAMLWTMPRRLETLWWSPMCE